MSIQHIINLHKSIQFLFLRSAAICRLAIVRIDGYEHAYMDLAVIVCLNMIPLEHY